jgi:hypothetical protein
VTPVPSAFDYHEYTNWRVYESGDVSYETMRCYDRRNTNKAQYTLSRRMLSTALGGDDILVNNTNGRADVLAPNRIRTDELLSPRLIPPKEMNDLLESPTTSFSCESYVQQETSAFEFVNIERPADEVWQNSEMWMNEARRARVYAQRPKQLQNQTLPLMPHCLIPDIALSAQPIPPKLHNPPQICVGKRVKFLKQLIHRRKEYVKREGVESAIQVEQTDDDTEQHDNRNEIILDMHGLDLL